MNKNKISETIKNSEKEFDKLSEEGKLTQGCYECGREMYDSEVKSFLRSQQLKLLRVIVWELMKATDKDKVLATPKIILLITEAEEELKGKQNA